MTLPLSVTMFFPSTLILGRVLPFASVAVHRINERRTQLINVFIGIDIC